MGTVQAGHHARVVITDVQPREAHQLVARIQLRVDARIHGTVQIAVVMQRAVRGEVTADRLQVQVWAEPSVQRLGKFRIVLGGRQRERLLVRRDAGSKRVPASYA